jgi:hypothetical protein
MMTHITIEPVFLTVLQTDRTLTEYGSLITVY